MLLALLLLLLYSLHQITATNLPSSPLLLLLLLPAIQSCRLMYDLPGADGECGTMIDLLDDDDLDMMWEELDSFMVRLNVVYYLFIYDRSV